MVGMLDFLFLYVKGVAGVVLTRACAGIKVRAHTSFCRILSDSVGSCRGREGIADWGLGIGDWGLQIGDCKMCLLGLWFCGVVIGLG